MKIGDRIFVRGYIDEIRKDTVIVRNDGGYFGTVLSEVTGELPSAQPERQKGYMKIKVISAVDGEGLFCENCDAYCLSSSYNFCPKCGVEFIGVRGGQDG